jgi:hypothetical protein
MARSVVVLRLAMWLAAAASRGVGVAASSDAASVFGARRARHPLDRGAGPPAFKLALIEVSV